jgi:lipopolysaccharide/colanic/teichoic acid biosynthesis glycosyltransferase
MDYSNTKNNPLPIPTATSTRQPCKLTCFSKRLLDLIAAFFGLLLLSPFFLILAYLIKRDSPGPVFYRGARLGRNGRLFKILKFRTMYEIPSSYQGPVITSQDDQRITPIGKWLRDTKLNELPQLWNVLLGDMSLVGPRPEDPAIITEWSESQRKELLSVRPGITSPASVLFRDEEQRLNQNDLMQIYFEEILPDKMRLDQLYVRHRSLWGDLDIIFWTLLILLPKISAVNPPEQDLFLGPIARLVNRHINWFLIDLLVALAAISLTGLIWRSLGPLDIGWISAFFLALIFAALKSLTAALLGVNRIQWSRAPAIDALDLLPGVIVATLVFLALNYSFPSLFSIIPGLRKVFHTGALPALPNCLILIAAVLSYSGFVIVRYRARLLTGLASRWLTFRRAAETHLERILIVGGGESGHLAAILIKSTKYASSFKIVGFVDDDMHKQELRIAGVPVIGHIADIPHLVEQKDIGILIFAIHNSPEHERQRLLEICQKTTASLFMLPDIAASLQDMALERRTE